MPAPYHPDPQFTPRINWEDPIPSIWRHSDLGRWEIFPPYQFEVEFEGEAVLWRLGGVTGSFYQPEKEMNWVPPGTKSSTPFAGSEREIEWGAPLVCRWSRTEDGRNGVQLLSAAVKLLGSSIKFACAPHQMGNYLYPVAADNVSFGDGFVGRAMYSGGPFELVENRDISWRRELKNGWMSLGELVLHPGRLRFLSSEKLYPIKATQQDIELAEAKRLSPKERENGDVIYYRLIPALAKHGEFMQAVGNGRFAQQVQCFLSSVDLRCEETGGRIVFTSDRNYGSILSDLRRYGENYTMYQSNWGKPDEKAQAEIAQMFLEAGFSVI